MPEPDPLTRRRTIVEAPPPPEPPPDRRIGWGMLLAIGVLALVALGILIAWLVTRDDRNASAPPSTIVITSNGTRLTTTAKKGAGAVAIPDVRGLDVDAAQARLRKRGLDSTTHQVGSSKPVGTVVSESPAPGSKVAKGSGVALAVARAKQVTVPGLSGQSGADAQRALRSVGLTAHVVTVPSGEPAGTVVAQHPGGGATAAGGSSVRLNVSAGPSRQQHAPPPPASTTQQQQQTTTAAQQTTQQTTQQAAARPTTATVPNVHGDQLQAAVHQLSAAGFRVSLAYVPGDATLGTVGAQSPRPGATAPTASHVTINASTGPGDKPQETVPDTTGQRLHQAVATLNAAHLRLIFEKRTVTVRSEAGTVIEQTPAAGAHAPQNAQVLVYLGAYRGG